MTVPQLLLGYATIGVLAAGVVLWRAPPPRRAAVPSALAALVVWPLWLPFALERRGVEARIQSALRRLAREHPAFVSSADCKAIASAVRSACVRLDEMHVQLQRSSRAKHQRSPPTDTTERTSRLAQRHRETLAELQALAARESVALDELADLLELLAAQLTLVELTESDSLAALETELWCRIEALGPDRRAE